MSNLSAAEQTKLKQLKDCAKNWKTLKNIHDPVLSGNSLCSFIEDLKKEAIKILSFSGSNESNLVLYSDYSWETVDTFCNNSNGNFYYVSQTEAGKILFHDDLAEEIRVAIGDRELAQLILDGKRPNGLPRVTHVPIEGTPGVDVLDNFWCEKLVIEALKDGKDVIVGVGNAVTADSVFAQTEYETFLKHAGDEQRLIIVDDLQAVSKENGVVHAVPKNVQFSATARDIRLLPDEPTTRMIFDEWGHLNFLQKLQELLKESEKVNYIWLTFVEPCAILGIVFPITT